MFFCGIYSNHWRKESKEYVKIGGRQIFFERGMSEFVFKEYSSFYFGKKEGKHSSQKKQYKGLKPRK